MCFAEMPREIIWPSKRVSFCWMVRYIQQPIPIQNDIPILWAVILHFVQTLQMVGWRPRLFNPRRPLFLYSGVLIEGIEKTKGEKTSEPQAWLMQGKSLHMPESQHHWERRANAKNTISRNGESKRHDIARTPPCSKVETYKQSCNN